ncbi:MAG: tRNA preQ1(34) S-adenosylmethionine ribosyltransferase-isomerase QueA [Candidatus Eremiobacteraeota bacterium]|nr:tRNA preQ1(34) S-adenosylmethionine ribosyltransferase-isomerase QueA [Candidatus Eremiobacteraeota bacterium]MBC5827903.1 tRNA preQ1(34) S-adenosylmethionine ribosyltransferase-isomerase QueA [Candidatus Eremiobacteraeota bacterium]
MGDPYAAASYAYALPKELIAQRPAQRRDEARLFVLPRDGKSSHHSFVDLPDILRPGDLLVANDSRVMQGRFLARRVGGGAAEVLLLQPSGCDGYWEALVRPSARIRSGDRLWLGDDSVIEVFGHTSHGQRQVRFRGLDAIQAMERFGHVPLPPYIKETSPTARARYQTVYAAHDGSAAAPTAGLHFTDELVRKLRAGGICWTTITLHIGAGTFRPVKSEDVRAHTMHAERYEIEAAAATAIRDARGRGGRIVAVGTTSLRALEDSGGEPASRATALFIHPPQRCRIADAVITNFHLPRSTLLMLICAFGGTERVLAAYEEAMRLRYRFYSFGDAMLVERSL